MPVLPQALFALVGSHLVPFSFLSTWHRYSLSELFNFYVVFNIINK